MMSLCPHFLPDYFRKVHDVLISFQPQISELQFVDIGNRLVIRKVITEQEYYDILQVDDNCLKIDKLISIIPRRIRGIEFFVLVLMEESYHPWLAEELFNSYLRHVAAPIKQMQGSNKCGCLPKEWTPLSDAVSLVKEKLSFVAKGVDNCLYNVGTSVGFMDQTLYPTKNILESINKRLAFLSHAENLEIPFTSKSFRKLDSQNQLFLTMSAPSEDNKLIVTSQQVTMKTEIGTESKSNPLINDVDTIQISEEYLHHNAITELHDKNFTDQTENTIDCKTLKNDSISSEHVPAIINATNTNENGDSNSNIKVKLEEIELPCLIGSDLEWDNYDMTINSLIQSQINHLTISPNLDNLTIVQVNQGKEPLQKSTSKIKQNHSPSEKKMPMKKIGRKTTTKQGTPPLAFNTTIKPRLSPSDYIKFQKSNEWCSKKIH